MTIKKTNLDTLHHRRIFIRKFIINLILGIAIITFSLCLGMFGYHYIEEMPWIDAYENAAMILSGMGPAEELKTDLGKIFAGTYALFSGIVFLVVIGLVFAPVIHRFLHKLPVEDEKKK